jgi:hypothetical protein
MALSTLRKMRHCPNIDALSPPVWVIMMQFGPEKWRIGACVGHSDSVRLEKKGASVLRAESVHHIYKITH